MAFRLWLWLLLLLLLLLLVLVFVKLAIFEARIPCSESFNNTEFKASALVLEPRF